MLNGIRAIIAGYYTAYRDFEQKRWTGTFTLENSGRQKNIHAGALFLPTDTVQMLYVCCCYSHSRNAAEAMGLRLRIQRIMETTTGRNGRLRMVAR